MVPRGDRGQRGAGLTVKWIISMLNATFTRRTLPEPTPALLSLEKNMRLHAAVPARDTPRLPAAPVPDWSKLARDDAVRVLLRDGRIVAGRIDMIAVDRSVFWVIQPSGRGRVMICNSDRPVVVRAAPDESRR
jgi:hypothetical protein